MPRLLAKLCSMLIERECVSEDARFAVVRGEGEGARDDGADGGDGVEDSDEIDIHVTRHCCFVVETRRKHTMDWKETKRLRLRIV